MGTHLNGFLAKTVPFTGDGWGWKVWLRNDDGTYRCIAMIANNAVAHALKDGLIARNGEAYAADIEITRGCTTAITVTDAPK